MNTSAEAHLAKAKDYLDKGDQFYRKAKPEIDAALAAGATLREVSRYLDKSKDWVASVRDWDGEGSLYAGDTRRRQIDQAKQVLREAPLENVEQIISALPKDRQRAIAGAAGNEYLKARQDYAEEQERMTPAERKEREAAGEAMTAPARRVVAGFTALGIVGHLEQALEELRELNADHSVTADMVSSIGTLWIEIGDEIEVARAMAGIEVQS